MRDSIEHPLASRALLFICRCHPTEGYQWWCADDACWCRGEPWPTDTSVSWEDTWCEPEADD